MALTSIDVAATVVSGSTVQIPRCPVAKIAITANDTLGVALTNTGTIERYIQFSSPDGAFYAHDIDAQTTANSFPYNIGDVLGVYVPMNATINIYFRAASGTTNVNSWIAR